MKKGDSEKVIRGFTSHKPSDNGSKQGVGITNPEYWEKDFGDMPFWTKIEKIMELPGIDNMPGVAIRSIIKDERQANAIVRLYYRHKKFKDDDHQDMLRMKLATTAAIGGVGRLDQLFAADNLLAPDMYRTARGMPKSNNGEEKVHRGGDFRQKETNHEE